MHPTAIARPKRSFQTGFCYPVTVQCNNREFRLIREACRKVLLYAIERCKAKYGFRLYALCIMSNPVHYLIEPGGVEFKVQSSKFKVQNGKNCSAHYGENVCVCGADCEALSDGGVYGGGQSAFG